MSEMEEIKKTLKELLELEVSSESELQAWNERADVIYEIDKGSKIQLPEVVWHYLSDADIRFKDPEYGEYQISGVKSFIGEV